MVMMIKTKCLHEEDRRPLLNSIASDQSEKLKLYEEFHYETAVTRGAVNYLGRWPGHIYAVFITGIMFFAALTLFGIILTAFVAPSEDRNRIFRNFESVNLSPNLYFVKHENRTWSSMELCYIESAARTWENLTIYLINLVTENRDAIPLSKFSIQLLHSNGVQVSEPLSIEILDQKEGTSAMIKRRLSSEEWRRRRELSAFYSNIKNVEVPIRNFFNGSMLVDACDNLNPEMLELAARAYILWNFPGVAIDPATVQRSLKSLRGYLCESSSVNRSKIECFKSKAAAVGSDGDILASSVPCQAFIGYLVRQIAKNERPGDRKWTIESAIDKFCPRSFLECPGVKRIPKMIDSQHQAGIFGVEKLDCPVIIPARTKKLKNTENTSLKPRNS